jgi:hypothetical protein
MNQIYGVWPDKFGLLQPGRTYKVEFSERKFNGKNYRTITKCEPAADPRSESGAGVEERTNDRGSESQRGSPNHPTTNTQMEAEFVARLLAASISACAVAHTQEALIAEARMLRSVWRGVFA